MKKPLLLCICDGFGFTDEQKGNAIATANTPNIDKLWSTYPHTYISASGEDVGLPKGQMGNSEVGHTNIGAGRIVYQDLSRITSAIETRTFFENPVLLTCMQNAKTNTLHLMGLLSDGGVHSHIQHLFALLDMAKAQGVERVYIHCFLDGRDVSPTSGAGFLKQLEDKLTEMPNAKIATVSGRYYAMDRDNRWPRTALAYNTIALTSDDVKTISPSEYIKEQYTQNVTDEFIVPAVFEEISVQKGDSVLFFNFRPDRARQLTRVFTDPEFTGFEREYLPVHFVCLTEYDALMPNVQVAYPPEKLTGLLGEVVANAGLTQLRIAETEKYAHVTFFFNGGSEVPYEGEERMLIPSPSVATYDLKPEMSAQEITNTLIQKLPLFDVVILNFANCDMVGHTGNFNAAVKAVETVNACVAQVVDFILNEGGTALITSDHGNAEKMYEEDGSPFTAHTTNLVPFIICSASGQEYTLKQQGGKLCDIAPTMLQILGIAKPDEMTGESLIIT